MISPSITKETKAEIACSAAKSSASKLVDVPSSKILKQAFHIALHFPCCINQSFIKVAVEIHDECLVSDALHWFSIDNFRGLLDAVCRDFVDPKFDTLAKLLIEICVVISRLGTVSKHLKACIDQIPLDHTEDLVVLEYSHGKSCLAACQIATTNQILFNMPPKL